MAQYENGISDLMGKLQKTNTLIEYMATVGLRQSEMSVYYNYLRQFNEDQIVSEHFSQNILQMHDPPILPQVTSRFPYIDKPDFPFPDEFPNVYIYIYFI